MSASSLSPAQRLPRKNRLDAAPTTDVQPVTETENLHEKLAVALARNSKFELQAEEGMMENERLAAEKMQNQDLARETDELRRVKTELTRQNDELTNEKDDLIREKEALIRETEALIGEKRI
jgi:hypothetical protein